MPSSWTWAAVSDSAEIVQSRVSTACAGEAPTTVEATRAPATAAGDGARRHNVDLRMVTPPGETGCDRTPPMACGGTVRRGHGRALSGAVHGCPARVREAEGGAGSVRS